MSAPKSHRWSKFWWQDYERDPALRSCSLSAQGLWMRMLCFMHEGEPYGHLTVNGRVPDVKRLAAMIGKAEREISNGLSELEDAGVFSRNEGGVIYSRRLVRDKEISDEAREHGALGGNPAITPRKTSPVNGGGNGGGLTPRLKHQEAEEEDRRKNPPLAPPQNGGAKNRGKTLIPADWEPDEQLRLFSTSVGLDPDATALNFRDFYLAQGKRVADVDAAWRLWCRVASAAAIQRKSKQVNGLMDMRLRMEAGEDVVGELLAEMEAERANGTTH